MSAQDNVEAAQQRETGREEEPSEIAARPDQVARLEAKYEERKAAKEQRQQENSLKNDPTENSNVFWQDFNGTKSEIMGKLAAAEAAIRSQDETKEECDDKTKGGGAAAAAAAASALLREANTLVRCQLGCEAGATRCPELRWEIWLAQRLGNDAVIRLHESVSAARQLLCPPASFSFKTRKATPLALEALISAARNEVGTTAGEDRLQGETKTEDMDPSLCFVDEHDKVLIKRAGEVRGRDLVLSRLKNCTVFVCDECGAVRADRLEGCKVMLGPVRSVLAEALSGCTLAVAAQQLRVHSSTDCDFMVRMRSGPIIEHSSRLRFAPYNFAYPTLTQQLAALSLEADNGTWCKVEDFNWLRAQHSPNWSLVPEAELQAVVNAPDEAGPAPLADAAQQAAVVEDEM